MAVQVIAGGTFTKDDGARPGLYVRFIDAAIAAIAVGSRSKVATVKSEWDTSGGTAENGKVYRIKTMKEANDLFGSAHTECIRQIINGGASEVVVATAVKDTLNDGEFLWADTLALLETYTFHVLVPSSCVADDIQPEMFTFLKSCRTFGKVFTLVLSARTATDAAGIVSESTTYKDEAVVFVANGVEKADGTVVTTAEYASYIAGLIAGTAIDGSLTFKIVPFANVSKRFSYVDVQTMLAAGLLVTVMDGDDVKIEQGLTLGDTSNTEFNKIRTVRAKQAIIDDISKAVDDNYVGRVSNNEDGQIAVINAVKVYLETLANANVLANDFTVELDPNFQSTGEDLYIRVGCRFIDSIEYVFLTISYS
jgi:hypothetical protein